MEFYWAYRYRNQHEARETYKTLKDQNIGNASVSASLYTEWAALEISAGESTYGRQLSGIGGFVQTLQQSISVGMTLTVGPCVRAAGESERALSIVRKGIKADAQPIRYMARPAPGTTHPHSASSQSWLLLQGKPSGLRVPSLHKDMCCCAPVIYMCWRRNLRGAARW